MNDVLKLTASGRYDKSTNFEGRFTPRITALVKVARDNNIRLSFQTAYRFPSTQDQYINLNTPGSKLIGGLPSSRPFLNFDITRCIQLKALEHSGLQLQQDQPTSRTIERSIVQDHLKPETVNPMKSDIGDYLQDISW